MDARVAIIIPTWNRADLLLECLTSIEAQTFRAYEIIVVDDGSTDNTAEAVQRNFPSARLIKLPENRGFCAAVNAGNQPAEQGGQHQRGCQRDQEQLADRVDAPVQTQGLPHGPQNHSRRKQEKKQQAGRQDRCTLARPDLRTSRQQSIHRAA